MFWRGDDGYQVFCEFPAPVISMQAAAGLLYVRLQDGTN